MVRVIAFALALTALSCLEQPTVIPHSRAEFPWCMQVHHDQVGLSLACFTSYTHCVYMYDSALDNGALVGIESVTECYHGP